MLIVYIYIYVDYKKGWNSSESGKECEKKASEILINMHGVKIWKYYKSKYIKWICCNKNLKSWFVFWYLKVNVT